MSAAFSAIFRTPVAAVIFAMEVSYIGIMRYAALVPCTLASLSASYIAEKLGLSLTHYSVVEIPSITPLTALQTLLLGILCAILSIIFCSFLHRMEHWMEKLFPNPYLRIAAGGAEDDMDQLLRVADERLYKGKTGGRNQIVGEPVVPKKKRTPEV